MKRSRIFLSNILTKTPWLVLLFLLPIVGTFISPTPRIREVQAACTPPPVNMVSWWTGDTDAADFHGSNPGSLVGGTTITAAKVSNGFTFDSDDDRVTVPHNVNLNAGTGFTVDFWMRGNKASQPGTFYTVVEKSHALGGNTGWAFNGTSATGVIRFAVGDGAGFPEIQSTTDVLDDVFHHVTGTWDGSNIRLYVDGVQEGGTAALTTPSNSAGGVNMAFFHGNGSPQRFYRGRLDEVEFFSRALTQTEIQDIVTAGTDGKCKLAPVITAVSHAPASPTVNDQITLSATATDAVGVTKIEIYLDGTAPANLLQTCNFGGVSPAACSVNAGLRSAGAHTTTVKAYNALAAVTTATDPFTVSSVGGSTCPTTGNNVTIPGNCTLAAGSYTYTGTLTVPSGVTVTAAGDTGANSGVIINSDHFSVIGTISADGQGFAPGAGPGTVGGGCGGCSGGAGHGGNGGTGFNNGNPVAGGVTYGSVTQPVMLGSGGGNSGGPLTGVGGGAIKLVASGTVTVSGTVSANGGNGDGTSGSGAGGSVWIDASTLSGAGTIRANGGSGTGNTANGTGAGGGGRVAINYTTDSSTWTRQAFGGSTPRAAGAGTIFMQSSAAGTGDLTVDNNNNSGANTTQLAAAQTFANITIRNAAVYVIPSGATLTMSATGTLTGGGTTRPNLTVNSGGIFNPQQASFTFNNINVTNNGTIGSVTSLSLASSTYIHNGSFSAGLANLTVQSGGAFEKSGTSSLAMAGTLTVQSGGTLTHTTNSTTRSHVLDISAATIDIQSGGTVTADTRGFFPGFGPGTGSGCGGCSSGGGYGGNGGTGFNNGNPVTGGVTYGSVTSPDDLGSGGGVSSDGGQGGGAIKLIASGTLTVAGTVTANGGDFVSNGGGAAGGSIWLSGATIAGAGIVRANGGVGNPGVANARGGGGGGRIALYYTTNSSTWTRTAFGGASGVSGGAGTIYVKASAAANGDLIVSNNDQTSANTTQLATSQTYANLTINNGSNYVIPSGGTLALDAPTSVFTTGGAVTPTLTTNSGGTFDPARATYAQSNITITNNGTIASVQNLTVSGSTHSGSGVFSAGLANLTIGAAGTFVRSGTVNLPLTGTLTVQSGGTLTHTTNTTARSHVLDISAATIDIQSGGSVNVDVRGFVAGNGPGTGSGCGGCSSGGGYGGNGGTGFNNGNPVTGGVTYGSVTSPDDLGSGGGMSSDGGQGGGAIKLIASGTLTVAGTVTANGGDFVSNGGGAAGGSIWLGGATITGAGIVRANGGVGNPGVANARGGGGGGRIALYYTTNSSTWTRTAFGGASSVSGGAGTIYVKASAAANGDLIVSNDNQASANTTQVTTASQTYDSITIQNGARVIVPLGFGLDSTGNLSIGGGTVAGSLTVQHASLMTVGGTLTIQNLGTLTHGANGTTKTTFLDVTAANIDVQVGGTITGSDLGFTSGSGPGTGVTVGSGNAGGGGYGGAGGAGASGGGAGGPAYGVSTNPIDIGSGGGKVGAAFGGSGGGQIRLAVSGTLTLNGAISTNGGAGTNTGTGGGSGGALNASVGTFTGSGPITADGGAGQGAVGGCGGGGRIFVSFGNSNYSGSPTALGACLGQGTRAGSDGTVLINQATDVTVTAPNGGESLAGGQSYSIAWTNVGTIDHYRVSLSTDSGATFPTTLTSSSTGSPYIWTVNNISTTTARIRVEALDGSNVVLDTDISNADFSIVQTLISVTAPNGGETFAGGQSSNVTWTSGGLIDHFRISLSTDSGATFPTVVTASTASSPYAWTVNNVTTTQARIRVEALDAANTVLIADASNANFTITAAGGGGGGTTPPSVNVIQPNGGETLSAGTTSQVVWSSGGSGIASYRLAYTADGGTNWNTFVTGVTANSYAWTVPDVNTTTARMRVEALNTGNSAIASDESNGNFTIVGTQPPPSEPPPTEPPPTEPPPTEPPPSEPPPETMPPQTTDPPPIPPRPAALHDYIPISETANSPTISEDKGLEPANTLIYPAGTLLQGGSDPTIYYVGADGKRYPFPDADTFLTWYPDFSGVLHVTAAQLAAVPLGDSYVTIRPGTRPVKFEGHPEVYAVTENGVLRLIPNEATAVDLYGPNWSGLVYVIPTAFASSYLIGPPIQTLPLSANSYVPQSQIADAPSVDEEMGITGSSTGTYPVGSLLRGSGPTIWYVAADGKRYAFPDDETFLTWYPDFSDVLDITDAQLAAVPIGSRTITKRPGVSLVKLEGDSTTIYVVGQGGVLLPLPDAATAADLYGPAWPRMIDVISAAAFAEYTVGPPVSTTSDEPDPPAEREHDFSPIEEVQADDVTIDSEKSLVAVANPSCRPGDLFRGTLSTVYYCGIDGKRYAFPNAKTFLTWFPDFSSVRRVSNDEVRRTPLGTTYVTYKPGVRMIKLESDPKTYAIGRGATSRHLTTETVASDLYGPDWNKKIDDIPRAFFQSYKPGTPIQ